MSQEDNTQSAPAATNMRGRWRRPAARVTGQPAAQNTVSFGAVEDIQTAKENLSGNAQAQPSVTSEAIPATVAQSTVVETVNEEPPVLVCCLEEAAPVEKPQAETAECGCHCASGAAAETEKTQDSPAESTACCQSQKADEASSTTACACAATVQETTAETPAAEAPAEKATDEAALLKTDWREERKRYVGLRPDPVDRNPERVRSRPYEERAERPRGDRPERSDRSQRPERSDRPQRSERLTTEVADKPRVSEYTPSHNRNNRVTTGQNNSERAQKAEQPKDGIIAKILRFFGIGKAKTPEPAARTAQNRPNYPRGQRSEGDRNRYGNRQPRNDREGGKQGESGRYRNNGGRRRRRSGGQGGNGGGGDYRRPQQDRSDSPRAS